MEPEVPRILRLEQTYRAQMESIRAKVHAFGEKHGWDTQSRGRKAHASLYGPINGVSGVIDVEMVFESWEACPERLEDSAPFIVWAGVFHDRSDGRYRDTQDFLVETTFGDVSLKIDEFLECAWQHLVSRSAADATDGPHPLARWEES